MAHEDTLRLDIHPHQGLQRAGKGVRDTPTPAPTVRSPIGHQAVQP